MLNNLVLILLVGIFGFSQSLFGITIINQTNSDKTIEIEEAYRPPSDKPGNLAAPITLGFPSQKIAVAAHSKQTISLKSTPRVLLVSVLSSKKKGKKTTTTEESFCFEPYDFEKHHQEFFNDDWGFVIHKPITGFVLPFTDPKLQWMYAIEHERGYGIRCLHPLLLVNVTSLHKLPDDWTLHFAGQAPWTVRSN